ncbi:PDZ domain-containing protein [Candidatus Neptunochlamydia vexilliferae]|uniref:Protease Do-like 10, mitochondrial n=1 Tax=Candidatus Neptunichlamydia vexilliferae TaxID=1651774 RepID=A0ABS0B034_9BACT|nr:S1C family serine protease [Candidatus Neptunochlamydia vexilliferae]MBF5059559.1 Protease Do-like 10, mitochondrial [Candidatus Neptunochlamydia vexilliferae]
MKVFFLMLISATLFASEAVDRSLVKIFTTVKEYDYEFPWQPPTTYQASGSGFIIEGNRIITNAHVIANASFIEVSSAGSWERFEATVKVVGHDCDLALLEVDDPTFFKGKQFLEFSDVLVEKEEEVQVHGFPMGGKGASATKGIVSRIEMMTYSHSRISLLISQIDAPINFGNSGGPVLSGGKVVGIVHQGWIDGQNIGYMIPIPIIRHFLEEVERENYEGFPEFSFQFQPMRSAAMRKYYGIDKDQGGLLITDIAVNHFLSGFLERGDILIEVDGYPIDRHGRIYFDDIGLTLPFRYAIRMKHYGDPLKVNVIRDGELCAFETVIDAAQKGGDLVTFEYDKPPTYYILGGFVFQPLVTNCISLDNINAALTFCNYAVTGKVTEDVDEVVILSHVLHDHANKGYQQFEKKIIDTVNGKKIRNLRDLIATLESSDAPYYHITTSDNMEMIIDREVANERHQKILNRYLIHSGRSSDLQ